MKWWETPQFENDDEWRSSFKVTLWSYMVLGLLGGLTTGCCLFGCALLVF